MGMATPYSANDEDLKIGENFLKKITFPAGLLLKIVWNRRYDCDCGKPQILTEGEKQSKLLFARMKEKAGQ